MKIQEITSEAKAPEKLCKSRIPDDQLGASQLASCKSQGLRARDSGDSYNIGGKKVKLRGKKIRTAVHFRLTARRIKPMPVKAPVNPPQILTS